MRLFLASEAKHPESMEKLDSYVGGLKGKKIGYIPTASNGEAGENGELPWGKWEKGDSWQVVNSIGAEVELILLEDCLGGKFPDCLIDKDIIWVAGGVCGYLMYWIRRTELDRHLPGLLKDNKRVYVGSSAGSMITGPNLDIVDWYIGEDEIGASIIPALSWVDFDIYPHYEDHLYDEIKQKYQGNKLYLLKNGEAIVVEDGKVKILGEERIVSTTKP